MSYYRESRTYTKRIAYDANGNIEYMGWAKPGASTDDAVWSVVKHTYDASNRLTATEFADGDDSLDNVWDDRATLTYS
ncbi:MAG: hypothetical protein ABFD89_00775 [Bryobacteraceae bacterium]